MRYQETSGIKHAALHCLCWRQCCILIKMAAKLMIITSENRGETGVAGRAALR